MKSMREKVTDYTKKRLGSVSERWQYPVPSSNGGVTLRIAESRILKCPACGRKGSSTGDYWSSQNDAIATAHKAAYLA